MHLSKDDFYKYRSNKTVAQIFLEKIKNNEEFIEEKTDVKFRFDDTENNKRLFSMIEGCDFENWGTNCRETFDIIYIDDFLFKGQEIQSKASLTKISKSKNGLSGNKKIATESANVNEFMTAYFLSQGSFDLENIEEMKKYIIDNSEKKTVCCIDENYDFKECLTNCLEDPDNILVGYNNAKFIKSITKKQIKEIYWAPRKKPLDIDRRNPSDIILKYTDNTLKGYSLKAGRTDKDRTPKMSPALSTMYNKVDKTEVMWKFVCESLEKAIFDFTHLTSNNKKFIETYTEKAMEITKNIKHFSKKNATSTQMAYELNEVVEKFDITCFRYGTLFHFFIDQFVEDFSKFIMDKENAKEFLQIIALYLKQDCPYDIVFGNLKRSRIILSSDEIKKIHDLLVSPEIKDIKFENNENVQKEIALTFKLKNNTIKLTLWFKVYNRVTGYSPEVSIPKIEIIEG